MSLIEFSINPQTCISCGECSIDCPARIIDMNEGLPVIIPEKEEFCYRCQHCLAICPTGALSLLGKNPSGSIQLAGNLFDPDKLEVLLKGRRSVRRYRDENLDPPLLQRLLDVACHAPTGMNSCQVLFTLLDGREKVARFRDEVMDGLGLLVREERLPEGMEFFADFVHLWEEKKVDIIFRGAPHVLIASAPRNGASPMPDCLIALTYFELFAQSMGIGTVWNGLFKWSVNDILQGMKEKLGIPDDHIMGYAISFGKPAVSYHRTVQRGPARVNRPVV